MSYLVLARKYRPHRFSEMVGQGHVVQALGNALRTQRLHHAYLFTGTRGVGKTTVSRILAKSLNCLGANGQGGITDEPCGVCQACSDIDAGRFVDYTELDAASNRSVEEVQSLLEQAVYKPVQGRFKVFMIDEVHMLSNTAFNAMLKTLEEPPPYLKFVLATTDPQKVPVTVLSRCLQFNLRPMAPETIVEHLQAVLNRESVSCEAGALRLIARAAQGSMRDALSLTDQAIAFGSGGLLEAGVRQMLGTVDRGHVWTLIEALALGQGRVVVDTTQALRQQGLSAASTLEEMSLALQRMAVLQAVPDAADPLDPDTPVLQRLSAMLPADETQLLYSLCLHGRSELGLAPDEYAALTMVLLRLLAFKPSTAQGQIQPSQAVSATPQAEKKTLKTADIAPVQPLTPVQPSAPLQPPASAASSLPVQAKQPGQPARPLPPDAAAAPSGRVLPVRDTQPASRLSMPLPVPQTPDTADLGSGADMASDRDGLVDTDTDTDIDSYSGTYTGTHGEPDASPLDMARDELSTAPTRLVPIPVRVPPESRQDLAAQHAGNGTLALTQEGDFWHALVQDLIEKEGITAMVRELALQAQLVARDADHWLLRVERESLNQGQNRERLAQVLHKAGHAVQLSVEVGRVLDSPVKRLNAVTVQRQQEAEQLIRNDPWVQALMAEFDAKIVHLKTV